MSEDPRDLDELIDGDDFVFDGVLDSATVGWKPEQTVEYNANLFGAPDLNSVMTSGRSTGKATRNSLYGQLAPTIDEDDIVYSSDLGVDIDVTEALEDAKSTQNIDTFLAESKHELKAEVVDEDALCVMKEALSREGFDGLFYLAGEEMVDRLQDVLTTARMNIDNSNWLLYQGEPIITHSHIPDDLILAIAVDAIHPPAYFTESTNSQMLKVRHPEGIITCTTGWDKEEATVDKYL